MFSSIGSFYSNNSTVINTVAITTVVVVGVPVLYNYATKTVEFDHKTIISLAKFTEEALKNKNSAQLRLFLFKLTMDGFKVGVKFDANKETKARLAEAIVADLHRVCAYIDLQISNPSEQAEREMQKILDRFGDLSDQSKQTLASKKWYQVWVR